MKAVWLLVRSSPLRWWAPVASVGCLALVAPKIAMHADTSIVASSEAGFAVLIWAPAATFACYLGVRATGLTPHEDVLILATSTRSRMRRTVSSLTAPLLWLGVAWLGFWIAADIIATRNATPLYWSMALNGLALSTLAGSLGAVLAIARCQAWVAGLGGGAVYLGLAVWSYVPENAATVLFSAYTPRFYASALPSEGYLALQLLWSVAVLGLLVLWCGRVLSAPITVLALIATAAITSGSATQVDVVSPRSGNLTVRCQLHEHVNICLWSDHELSRPLLEADVTLAHLIAGRTSLPKYLVESDIADGVPAAMPRAAHGDAVIVSSTAHPKPRAAAAALVVRSLQFPTRCPRLDTWDDSEADISFLAERLVADGATLDGSKPLSDAAIATWVAHVQHRIADCRTPAKP